MNSDQGLNHPDCEPAESLSSQPCHALPKAQWASVTASVDWASFDGKIDDEHGYDAVESNCDSVIMSLNALSGEGSREEQTAYRKAARAQIKSVRCRFDPDATKAPVLKLGGGVLTAGFNWETGSERQLQYVIAEWLVKKI